MGYSLKNNNNEINIIIKEILILLNDLKYKRKDLFSNSKSIKDLFYDDNCKEPNKDSIKLEIITLSNFYEDLSNNLHKLKILIKKLKNNSNLHPRLKTTLDQYEEIKEIHNIKLDLYSIKIYIDTLCNLLYICDDGSKKEGN